MRGAIVEVMYLLVGVIVLVLMFMAPMLLTALLLGHCGSDPEPASPAVYVSDDDLDALEARLLWSHATVRHWEDLAERRRKVEPVLCESLTRHALQQSDTRLWAARGMP